MASGSMATRLRLMGLVARQILRKVLAFVQFGPLSRWRLSGPSNGHLVLAPRDLRTSDPTIAADIYSGRFVFHGQVVEANNQSVFKVNPPSSEWASGLHEFGWLRHLRNADSALAGPNARALVMDWITIYGSWNEFVWSSDLTARRVIVWLSQSPLILEETDHATYRTFMKSLTRQVRYLRQIAGRTDPGIPKLRIAIALCFASLTMSNQSRFIRSSQKRLDMELKAQILNDGGHISRNPSVLLNILADLLPLRQTYMAQGLSPSDTFLSFVDRMMLMLRFFRHGDGSFAHFNGTGSTQTDLLATVLAYDDTRGTPLSSAGYSNYQRLEAGKSLVLMDIGTPPPIAHSEQAHAGCLSFELSYDTSQVIVNCGVPSSAHNTLHQLARSTAAHSTVTLGNTSSCQFISGPKFTGLDGAPIISGPTKVPFGREDGQDRIVIRASHDGYVDPLGITHERELALATDGNTLTGKDILRRKKRGKKIRTPISIRFHLHPQVRAARSQSGAILLTLPNREGWEFSAEGANVVLEESIYLSGSLGHQRADQIVIESNVGDETIIDWSLKHLSRPKKTASTPEPEEKLL